MTPDILRDLRLARQERDQAESRMKRLVQQGLHAGISKADLHRASGLSRVTINRWDEENPLVYHVAEALDGLLEVAARLGNEADSTRARQRLDAPKRSPHGDAGMIRAGFDSINHNDLDTRDLEAVRAGYAVSGFALELLERNGVFPEWIVLDSEGVVHDPRFDEGRRNMVPEA